jgi:hypothetical protein
MPQPILDPLWSLIISTNDCFPGCGCDDDFFDMSPERIDLWIYDNDYHAAIEASQVLVALRDSQPLDYEALSMQTNLQLADVREAIQWLDAWQSLINECIHSHSLQV